MRINSGFSKVKQINGKCDDSDGATADQILLYLMIDEMKENDHNIQVAAPMPFSNSLYKRGYVGDAFVTHLIDQIRGICYIINCESMPRLKGQFNQQLQSLEHIPEPREQFAYLYEGTMLFRAIRCDEFAPYTDDRFDVFLTDIGCKIKVDINKSKQNFCVLSDTVKSVSGYMRKCQIVNMPRDLNTLDLLHTRIQYNIIFNDGETVYINILAKDAQDFYANQPDDQQNFYSYLWANSAQLSSLKKNETPNASPGTVSEAIPVPAEAKGVEYIEPNMTKTRETIPATASESSQDKVAEITAKNIAEPAENSCKHNGTKIPTVRNTRRELTTMLYNLKEEDLKLLDKELPHDISEPQPQAVSHKKLMTILQSSNVPSVGTKMTVQATDILDVSKFYGHNVEDTLRYDEFFNRFNPDSLCKIDSQPQVNDRILVIYENEIHRAVVTQILDINLFQVFYLDSGHCYKVTSANIFKWDPSMDELPYRALRFRINRIRPLFENDICGIYGAQRLLLASVIGATVVDVCDDGGLNTIVIDAIDENGLDIATTLIMKNLAACD